MLWYNIHHCRTWKFGDNNRGLRSSSSLMRRIVPITVDELFRTFRRKRNAENATSYFIFIPAKAYHEKREHIIIVNYIIILGIFRSVYNCLLISATDPFVTSYLCAYISLTLGFPFLAFADRSSSLQMKSERKRTSSPSPHAFDTSVQKIRCS